MMVANSIFYILSFKGDRPLIIYIISLIFIWCCRGGLAAWEVHEGGRNGKESKVLDKGKTLTRARKSE